MQGEPQSWPIFECGFPLVVYPGEATMRLAWLSPPEWRKLLLRAGFAVEACYGWFDRRPYTGGEDTVWIARAD